MKDPAGVHKEQFVGSLGCALAPVEEPQSHRKRHCVSDPLSMSGRRSQLVPAGSGLSRGLNPRVRMLTAVGDLREKGWRGTEIPGSQAHLRPITFVHGCILAGLGLTSGGQP